MLSFGNVVILVILFGGGARGGDDFQDAELEFVDCGSDFDVHEIVILGCTSAFCPIYLGETTNVTINATNLDIVSVSDMKTEASIIRQSASWTIDLSPQNPCLHFWNCPLSESKDLTFKGMVNPKDYSILGAATLEMRITYQDNGISINAVCVQVKVDVARREVVESTTSAPAAVDPAAVDPAAVDPAADDIFDKVKVNVFVRRNNYRKM